MAPQISASKKASPTRSENLLDAGHTSGLFGAYIENSYIPDIIPGHSISVYIIIYHLDMWMDMFGYVWIWMWSTLLHIQIDRSVSKTQGKRAPWSIQIQHNFIYITYIIIYAYVYVDNIGTPCPLLHGWACIGVWSWASGVAPSGSAGTILGTTQGRDESEAPTTNLRILGNFMCPGNFLGMLKNTHWRDIRW